MSTSKHFTALFLLFCFAVAAPLAAQSGHGDCATARVLCNQDAVVLDALPGPGDDPAEVSATACLAAPLAETHSAWFRWTVAESGTLELALTPLLEGDDLDFVLYRLPALSACAQREEVRCLLSGPVLGEAAPDDAPCRGATGLTAGAVASASIGIGCPPGAGGFLPPVPVQAGESYALFVHNFRSAAGFVLEFAGSCAFAPVPGLCASVQAAAPDAGERLTVSGVMPNPAVGGAAQIALRTDGALSGSLSVTDASGRLRSTAPLRLAPGEHVLHLDLSTLEPGAYWANLALGEHRRSLRFVRQ